MHRNIKLHKHNYTGIHALLYAFSKIVKCVSNQCTSLFYHLCTQLNYPGVVQSEMGFTQEREREGEGMRKGRQEREGWRDKE